MRVPRSLRPALVGERSAARRLILSAHVLWTALQLINRAVAADPPPPSGAGSPAPTVSSLPDAEARQRIDAALPTKAIVPTHHPRRLLIFDLNVGYGGHPSSAYANYAFTQMGEKTGAYQTVISHEPAVFAPESLKQFDAVFFNNTVGNLFTDPALRQSLVHFVYRGGGLLGVHGTSVAFTRWPGAVEDWPEFGVLIGARGANHRENTERVIIKLDDPSHPLNRVFPGQGFEYRDEFFRVHEPYSRGRVRVLLRIDTERTDLTQGRGFGSLERADKDFALAWVRNYGRGRVFYCTIAHNPYVFWDPLMLQFYLGALQFALGDLPAPTRPSRQCTPAVRAQEKLGWRLGLAARGINAGTLFDAINQAATLSLGYLAASDAQNVSPEIAKPLDDRLTEDALRDIRRKLDAAAVRLVSYEITQTPADLPAWRRAFAFARDLGVEVIVARAPRESLADLAPLCQEFGLRLALSSSSDRGPRADRRPGAARGDAQSYAPWIGMDADLAQWQRTRVDPILAVRKLRDRIIVVRLGSSPTRPQTAGRAQSDPSLCATERFLQELWRLRVHPLMFALPSESIPTGQAARWVEAFNQVSLRLAP